MSNFTWGWGSFNLADLTTDTCKSTSQSWDLTDDIFCARNVATKYGPVQGVLQQPTDSLQPVATFLGIPFATPPLGNLRFMPPVTVAPWKETLLANRFRPVCPQNIPDVSNTSSTGPRLSSGRAAEIRRSLRLLSSQSEDCLYLNVYTPASGEPLSLKLTKHR